MRINPLGEILFEICRLYRSSQFNNLQPYNTDPENWYSDL